MKKLILPALITTLLAACGGGSSDSSSKDQASFARYIQGSLDKVDEQNIQINGITIPVAKDATLSRNGNTDVDLTDFAANTPVTIITDGKQATAIEYDANLRGPISEVAGNTLTVAGFTVQLPASSSHLRNGDQGWQVGQQVEISGVFNGEIWLAQHIELDDDLNPDEVELEGTVTLLDQVKQTFQIGTLIVNYGNAINDSDDGETLQNGAWVEVEGQFNSDSNTLTATEYEVEDLAEQPDFENQEIDIEGAILAINNDRTRLTVSPNWSVDISGNVEYDDGSKQDLALGKIIEVEGRLTNGVIIAEEIEFDDDLSNAPSVNIREFEIEGVAQYNSQTQTLSVNGVAVVLSANTEWDDTNANHLQSGHWISVEGRLVNGLLVDELEWDSEYPTTPELEDGYHQISLEGEVKDGQIWGYHASDSSLDAHNGKWLELECRINDSFTAVHNCKKDD